MSDLEFSVRMRADGKGLQGELRVTEKQLNELRRATDRTTAATDRAARSTANWGARLGSVARGIVSFKAGIVALGLGVVANDLKNVALETERWMLGLRAATGSTEAAFEEMRFLRREAERLGLEIGTLTDNYVSLVAASKGTALQGKATREIFIAAAEASRVYGLSAQQTGRVLAALQQIMSKGAVQAEELRGQLGDALPGAFQIASRAMGVTTAELGKMLEKGQVLADDFLPKFAKELRNAVAPGVEEAIGGSAAAFARMDNAMRDLKDSAATSGLIDFLADAAVKATALTIELGKLLEQMGLLERRIEFKERDELTSTLEGLQARSAGLQQKISNTENLIKGLTESQASVAGKRFKATKKALEEELNGVTTLISRYQAQLAKLGNGGGVGSGNAGSDGLAGRFPPRPRGRPNGLGAEELKREAAARKARAAAESRALERLRQSIQPTRAAFIQYTADVQRLKRGITDKGELRDALKALDEQFKEQLTVEPFKNEAIDGFKELRIQSLKAKDGIEQDVRAWTGSISSNLAQTLTGAEVSWKGTLHRMTTALLESQLDDLLAGAFGGKKKEPSGILGALLSSVGSVFSSASSPATAAVPSLAAYPTASVPGYHSGGMAGGPGSFSRSVSMALFENAPRYHGGGVAGDEVPAILRRGEIVSTPEQYAVATGGVTVNQTIHIDAGGDGDVGERIAAAMERTKHDTINALVRAVNSGGPMAAAFGRR